MEGWMSIAKAWWESTTCAVYAYDTVEAALSGKRVKALREALIARGIDVDGAWQEGLLEGEVVYRNPYLLLISKEKPEPPLAQNTSSKDAAEPLEGTYSEEQRRNLRHRRIRSAVDRPPAQLWDNSMPDSVTSTSQ